LDNFPLFQDISETLDMLALTCSLGTQNYRAMGRALMLQKPSSAHCLESRDEIPGTPEQKGLEAEKVNTYFQYCSIMPCLERSMKLFLWF